MQWISIKLNGSSVIRIANPMWPSPTKYGTQNEFLSEPYIVSSSIHIQLNNYWGVVSVLRNVAVGTIMIDPYFYRNEDELQAFYHNRTAILR